MGCFLCTFDFDWIKMNSQSTNLFIFSVSFDLIVQSAELYLGVEMVKEAIDMFIVGELWAKAKKCAADMAPK